MQVRWVLTDAQLAYLAAQAVRIVKHRAGMGLMEADGLRASLMSLIGSPEAA